MTQLKRVLIMAGGTGGHVFPGLAVAHFLREQGVEVHWLGTEQGIESQIVPEAQFPLHLITISGMRGKGLKTLLTAPIKITKAVFESRKIINKIDPDVVIGMGGFVSGPGGVASWLTRRPLIIHEQNAKAGLTNKILANLAQRILTGFPNAFNPTDKVMVVGNPVRSEIEQLPAPDQRMDLGRSSFRLLVLGGSLGAKALNEIVPQALVKLDTAIHPEVFHQSGNKHLEETIKSYQTKGIKAQVVPFIKNMAEVYSWADMVICRAGALTVAELCTVGLGAIFVPFPFAVDDHQTANANYMVNGHAALCIQQSELTDTRLADIVSDYAKSPEKRLAMAQAAYQLRQVKVAEKIYHICKEIGR